ncbi:hypothetical protein LZ198_26240 [Myxococcus sp. K15C18031901]|uniref:hypothetical protein n=1 Tax=Myxococcus dinghuensis TaxID=2906761 RepID=UPI0020A6EF21|nr:hypothetical protein [Myxococcus dinghuensis]MCP3102376.1 hypothetical protein [Myxococcus dinghuensis]
MTFPSDSDYQLALQHPRRAFSDEALREGVVETGTGALAGLPRPRAGAFATTYKVQHGEQAFAVRCFTRPIPKDLESRYLEFERHLSLHWVPETVGFTFLARGVLVRGRWWPAVKMDWVQGESLERHVAANLEHPGALFALAVEWLELLASLRAAGIAHGDLHHGNVLVTPEGLRLVDYDGMFVPALEGAVGHEFGHAHYQHPRRPPGAFHGRLDHFPAWSVWLSLVALAHEPSLWTRLQGGDDCLLFKRKDYEAPERSAVFQALQASPFPRVRDAVARFRAMLALPAEEVPALDVAALASWRGEARPESSPSEESGPAEVMRSWLEPRGRPALAFGPEHSGDQQMATGLLATAALGLVPSVAASAGWLLGVGAFGALGLWSARGAYLRHPVVRQVLRWEARRKEARRMLDDSRVELARRERDSRQREKDWRDANAQHIEAQQALHGWMRDLRLRGVDVDRTEIDLLEGRRAQLDREEHNARKDLEAALRSWREDAALQATLSETDKQAWERNHGREVQRLTDRFDELRLALEATSEQEEAQARARGLLSWEFRNAMEESRRLSAAFRTRDLSERGAWLALRRARLSAHRELLESGWALGDRGQLGFPSFLLHLLRALPENG